MYACWRSRTAPVTIVHSSLTSLPDCFLVNFVTKFGAGSAAALSHHSRGWLTNTTGSYTTSNLINIGSLNVLMQLTTWHATVDFPHPTFYASWSSSSTGKCQRKGFVQRRSAKDFGTQQRLQPNSPDVVQQNTRLTQTDMIEGGKSQERWQCDPLCRTDQHTDPQQIDHGGAKRWSQILPDLKNRAPIAS